MSNQYIDLKKISHSILLKHDSTTTKYNVFKINDLIKKAKKKIVADFSDLLIYNDTTEFLSYYYKKKYFNPCLKKCLDRKSKTVILFCDSPIRKIIRKNKLYLRYYKHLRLKHSSPHPSIRICDDISHSKADTELSQTMELNMSKEIQNEILNDIDNFFMDDYKEKYIEKKNVRCHILSVQNLNEKKEKSKQSDERKESLNKPKNSNRNSGSIYFHTNSNYNRGSRMTTRSTQSKEFKFRNLLKESPKAKLKPKRISNISIYTSSKTYFNQKTQFKKFAKQNASISSFRTNTSASSKSRTRINCNHELNCKNLGKNVNKSILGEKKKFTNGNKSFTYLKFDASWKKRIHQLNSSVEYMGSKTNANISVTSGNNLKELKNSNEVCTKVLTNRISSSICKKNSTNIKQNNTVSHMGKLFLKENLTKNIISPSANLGIKDSRNKKLSQTKRLKYLNC